MSTFFSFPAASTLAPREPDPSFEEAIMQVAVDHKKQATFRYAKGDGGVLELRKLDPEQIFSSRNGHVLVGGYDPDRDEYRAYRVDRIKGAICLS